MARTLGSRKDFIPANANDLNVFTENFISVVSSKMTAWKHIAVADLENLQTHHDQFADMLTEAVLIPTPANTAARRDAQNKLGAAIRQFVNQYLRYSPVVTDVDRIKMHIPVRDTVRTTHMVVTEKVDFVLHANNIREISIDFWILGTDHKAKPIGYDGAIAIWKLSETPPTSHKDFTDHIMASRTPFVLHFEEEDRGKRVFVALAWQNERGIRGEWSEFKMAIIS